MRPEYITTYRGYQVKPHKEQPTSYVIVTDGKGGSIPKSLEGLFTSRTIANNTIDHYLGVKDKNAETVPKSRGK